MTRSVAREPAHLSASAAAMENKEWCWELLREIGGARRDRTADLVIANDALSQLSYGPFLGGPGGPSANSAIYNPGRGQVKNGQNP